MEIINKDENELQKIISSELYYFNKEIKYILENEENIWNKLKNYIKLGYRLFEGIRDIKDKNNIKFNKGLDLFVEDEQINIKKAIDSYEEIKIFLINIILGRNFMIQ